MASTGQTGAVQAAAFSRSANYADKFFLSPLFLLKPDCGVNLCEDGTGVPAGVSDMNNTCKGCACTHCEIRTGGGGGVDVTVSQLIPGVLSGGFWPSGRSFTNAHTTVHAASVTPTETRAVLKVCVCMCVCVCVLYMLLWTDLCVCSHATCVLLCILDSAWRASTI